eukprot:4813325-Amphidinium_carterae.1
MPETPAFDFDAFVGMIDKYRRTLVEERRMQVTEAALSQNVVDNFCQSDSKEHEKQTWWQIMA